jgi:hypothetical protein
VNTIGSHTWGFQIKTPWQLKWNWSQFVTSCKPKLPHPQSTERSTIGIDLLDEAISSEECRPGYHFWVNGGLRDAMSLERPYEVPEGK